MIALKVLLMVAGVLLLASAIEIPLYDLWIRIRNARRKAGGRQKPQGADRKQRKHSDRV